MALNSRDALLKALQLPPNLDDEEITRHISTIITAGTIDESYRPSLKDVRDAILQYQGGTTLLEPLDVLPDLLRSSRQEAIDLIHLIAENSSPKEVLVVISETLEQLTQLSRDDEEQDLEISDVFSTSSRYLRNVSVPRLILGRRTALNVISPLISSVDSLVSSLGNDFGDSGRTLLMDVSRMSEVLYIWVLKTGSETDAAEAREIIRVLLETTVVACASRIKASLCARAFETHYPRLTVASAVEPDWKEGEEAIASVLSTFRTMNLSSLDILKNPTTSSLIILAHEQGYPLPKDLFTRMHPILVASIQMNLILDESLFLIFRGVTQGDAQPDLPPEFATSLCIVLPALASTHLDPFIRHFSLRLIALILARLPSALRQQILITLTTDMEFPQMRAAAVGLLKQFVLEALQNIPASSGEQSIFASPLLLRSFGPILFRTMPSDYLTTITAAEDIEKSLELSRLSEVLSFYYVLLQRDKDNKTGVRDADSIASVESSLLRPLRSFLEKWLNAEVKPVLSAIALQIGLERIDSAIQTIRSR